MNSSPSTRIGLSSVRDADVVGAKLGGDVRELGAESDSRAARRASRVPTGIVRSSTPCTISGGPDAVPGFVLMKLVPGRYSATFVRYAEHVDLAARPVLAVEEVP